MSEFLILVLTGAVAAGLGVWTGWRAHAAHITIREVEYKRLVVELDKSAGITRDPWGKPIKVADAPPTEPAGQRSSKRVAPPLVSREDVARLYGVPVDLPAKPVDLPAKPVDLIRSDYAHRNHGGRDPENPLVQGGTVVGCNTHGAHPHVRGGSPRHCLHCAICNPPNGFNPVPLTERHTNISGPYAFTSDGKPVVPIDPEERGLPTVEREDTERSRVDPTQLRTGGTLRVGRVQTLAEDGTWEDVPGIVRATTRLNESVWD